MNRELPNTEEDLSALLDYLISTQKLPKEYAGIQAQYDPLHDVEAARAFCYVREDFWLIYCSCALENVSGPVRVGILLHEIGHICQNAFQGVGTEDAEVTVDEWVNRVVPEAQYHYRHEQYMWRSPTTNSLTAINVQCVDAGFYNKIKGDH